MAVSNEDIVQQFCGAWGDGDTATPDVERILDMFAEDGEWALWVPGPTIKGRTEIRAEIERQIKFSTYMKCGITKIVSAGNTVVTERIDHFTMHGIRVRHALVAMYDLDDSGKIRSWREYFDTADIGRQLGIPPETVIEG